MSLIAVSVLVLVAPTHADTTVIFTEDFEGYGVADGDFSANTTILTNGGWTVADPDGNLLNPADTGPTADWLNPVPAELGTTFLGLNKGGWFWRDLGVTIEGNKVYTFSVTHFKRDDTAGDAVQLRLLADSATGGFTNLTFAAVTNNDTYVTRTISYDPRADPSQVGKSLGILLFDSNGGNSGNVAGLDNISVSATAHTGVVFTEDFEGYGIADGAFAGNTTILANRGWTVADPDGNLLNPADTGSTTNWLNPVPAELGTTFATLSKGGWFWRDLGVTIAADTVYEFSLTHFKRDDQDGDAVQLRFLADSVTGGFHSDTFSAVTNNGTYVTRTITWNSGADDSQNGNSLGILIFDSNGGTSANQAGIDNISVSIIEEGLLSAQLIIDYDAGQLSVTATNMATGATNTLQGTESLVPVNWVDLNSTSGVKQVTWPIDESDTNRFFRVRSI